MTVHTTSTPSKAGQLQHRYATEVKLSNRVAPAKGLGMTVAEFIRTLETHPPGLHAMAQGYQDCYCDLGAGRVSAGEASLNVNSAWCCRCHEQVLSGDKPTGHKTVRGLFLRRPSQDDGG